MSIEKKSARIGYVSVSGSSVYFIDSIDDYKVTPLNEDLTGNDCRQDQLFGLWSKKQCKDGYDVT